MAARFGVKSERLAGSDPSHDRQGVVFFNRIKPHEAKPEIVAAARFGAKSEPLADTRGSDPSHDRQGVIFFKRIKPHEAKPDRVAAARFGAKSEPLADTRGSDPSHNRQGVVFFNRINPHEAKPEIVAAARFGAKSEPLADTRGSDPSHDRQGVIFFKRIKPHEAKPDRVAASRNQDVKADSVSKRDTGLHTSLFEGKYLRLAVILIAVSLQPVVGGNLSSDPALSAPVLQTAPGPEYAESNRKFQGIPGIERAPNGRLWAVWYAGDTREGPQNYVLLSTSGNDGKTWSPARLVIDPPGFVRAFDACVWKDPEDRLWLFWAQAAGHWDGRGGVWTAVSNDPDSDHPRWSKPRRIADGVLLNKPIVLKSGEWLLPIAIWTKPTNLPFINKRDKLNLSDERVRALSHDLGAERGMAVFSSKNGGKTFLRVGSVAFPAEDSPTEPMLIERRDGSIWMLTRTRYGIASSVSHDCGRTWSAPVRSTISQPSTRFFIRRLKSGRLLLVKNTPPNGKDRSNMTAYFSRDDGKTWLGGFDIDDRMNVSYPDGVESPDGKIYVVYDRERFTAREILMATFREKDVLAGKPVTADARLRIIVSKAGRP